jgi:hypothetical protein
VEEEELAVVGGCPISRLDLRLLIDDELPKFLFAWVEGGREVKSDEDEIDVSIVMERRCSENEVRPSLMKSLTIVIEDLRSVLLPFFEDFDELDNRLSSTFSLTFSFKAVTTAFW